MTTPYELSRSQEGNAASGGTNAQDEGRQASGAIVVHIYAETDLSATLSSTGLLAMKTKPTRSLGSFIRRAEWDAAASTSVNLLVCQCSSSMSELIGSPPHLEGSAPEMVCIHTLLPVVDFVSFLPASLMITRFEVFVTPTSPSHSLFREIFKPNFQHNNGNTTGTKSTLQSITMVPSCQDAGLVSESSIRAPSVSDLNYLEHYLSYMRSVCCFTCYRPVAVPSDRSRSFAQDLEDVESCR